MRAYDTDIQRVYGIDAGGVERDRSIRRNSELKAARGPAYSIRDSTQMFVFLSIYTMCIPPPPVVSFCFFLLLFGGGGFSVG